FAGDEALFLQGLQVAHDAVGRTDLEVIANFADGRAVAAIANFVTDELVHILLSIGQLIRHGHDGCLPEVEWSPDVPALVAATVAGHAGWWDLVALSIIIYGCT